MSENISRVSTVREPSISIQGRKTEYVNINDAIPGQVVKEGEGEFLLVKRCLSDLHENAREIITEFPCRIRELRLENTYAKNMEAFRKLQSIHPSKILFLDIETCGLSASPLFLIGVGYFTGEDFSLVQLLARELNEERPLLSFFGKLLSQYNMLVTFNGITFDLPFIISRGYANRIRIPESILHLDLLHEVRRQWRYRLPNCRLQTVEQNILNRTREGDIPGRDIPEVYREFARTGNAEHMTSVLTHNVLDVITMIDIIMILYSGSCAHPAGDKNHPDSA